MPIAETRDIFPSMADLRRKFDVMAARRTDSHAETGRSGVAAKRSAEVGRRKEFARAGFSAQSRRPDRNVARRMLPSGVRIGLRMPRTEASATSPRVGVGGPSDDGPEDPTDRRRSLPVAAVGGRLRSVETSAGWGRVTNRRWPSPAAGFDDVVFSNSIEEQNTRNTRWKRILR